MAIKQAVDDGVEMLAGLAQEAAGVVDHAVGARVLVNALGMKLVAQMEDGRVDLDGGDAFRRMPQCGGHVVAGAGPDDQHVARPGLQAIGEVVILRCLGIALTDGDGVRRAVEDILVEAVIHLDAGRGQDVGFGGQAQRDNLVGRVKCLLAAIAHQALANEDTGQAGHGDGQGAAVADDERRQEGQCDAHPHRGAGPGQGQQEKQADAEQAAEQVEGVALDARQAFHEPAGQLAQGDKHDGVQDEDQGQEGVALDGVEPGPVSAGGAHDQLFADGVDAPAAQVCRQQEAKQGNLQGQERQERGQGAAAFGGQTEADADAEEARQQADVLEDGEGVETGGVPADDEQFGVEGQGAGGHDGQGGPAPGELFEVGGMLFVNRIPPVTPAT